MFRQSSSHATRFWLRQPIPLRSAQELLASALKSPRRAPNRVFIGSTFAALRIRSHPSTTTAQCDVPSDRQEVIKRTMPKFVVVRYGYPSRERRRRQSGTIPLDYLPELTSFSWFGEFLRIRGRFLPWLPVGRTKIHLHRRWRKVEPRPRLPNSRPHLPINLLQGPKDSVGSSATESIVR